MIRKLMMVLAAMVCMAAYAKEGLIDIDLGYAKLRGRTHLDGLVIFRNGKTPVICRLRKATDGERKEALAKWGEKSENAVVMTGLEQGRIFLFVKESVWQDDSECKRGIAYLLDAGGRWEQGVFSMRDLFWNEKDIWGNYWFSAGGRK